MSRGIFPPPTRWRAFFACLVAAGVLGCLAALALIWLGPGRNAVASRPSGETWFTGTQWQQAPKIFPAHDFTLPDQNRQPIALHQFRGRVVLVSFTSSVCRQQCPLVGRDLTLAEQMLGPLARRTVLLNVSVDPEADSRQTVYRFAREMGWQGYRWYYLWAARPRMQPVWKAYDVYVQPPPPIFKPGLNIVHLAALAMIDQSGHVRAYFAYPFLPGQIARGVRDLLEGTA